MTVSGGLFEKGDDIMQQVFIYANEWVNENDALNQYNLVPDVHEVDPYDSYQVSKKGEGVGLTLALSAFILKVKLLYSVHRMSSKNNYSFLRQFSFSCWTKMENIRDLVLLKPS